MPDAMACTTISDAALAVVTLTDVLAPVVVMITDAALATVTLADVARCVVALDDSKC